MLLNPDLARDALRVLAKLQATEDDPWRDAEPGQDPARAARRRAGRRGDRPHTPYYGTVDATPLFLMCAADYYAWTGDLETLRVLRPALDAALRWIDEYGDRDGDGFVEYERRSPGGLQQPGVEGLARLGRTCRRQPRRRVRSRSSRCRATCTRAKLTIADVYAALGAPERARCVCATRPQHLREAFNEAFWNPAEGTFALALDGRKRQVASVTSNPGHCLYCGIVEPNKASAVAERLMARGHVLRLGGADAVERLSCVQPDELSQRLGVAARQRDHRRGPEALRPRRRRAADRRRAVRCRNRAPATSGFPSSTAASIAPSAAAIVAYPVACIPQAWAAAAPFLLLQAMLGISADAPGSRAADRAADAPGLAGADPARRAADRRRQRDARLRTRRSVTGFALLEQRGNST